MICMLAVLIPDQFSWLQTEQTPRTGFLIVPITIITFQPLHSSALGLNTAKQFVNFVGAHKFAYIPQGTCPISHKGWVRCPPGPHVYTAFLEYITKLFRLICSSFVKLSASPFKQTLFFNENANINIFQFLLPKEIKAP